MKFTLEVPDHDAEFVLEFLRRVTSVKLTPVGRRAGKQAAPDTTDYLLASPANAERLQQAYEQFDKRERVDFTLPAK